MNFKLCSILPVLALTLGACELSVKNLGDPNVDSATDSSSASDSASTEGATGGASESASATGAETDSSVSETTLVETSTGSGQVSDTNVSETTAVSETSTGSGQVSDTNVSETTAVSETSTSSSRESDTNVSESTAATETDGGTTEGVWDLCGEPLQAAGVSKSCESDQDCAVVFQQVDCCETKHAFGVNLDSVDAFDAAAKPCTMGPICDCAPLPTPAEDGDQTLENESIVAVCVDNQCQSQVP